jgi:hypothetical protein
MAEVLVEFEDTWKGADGRQYGARVCARGREDGLWEGWLEFTPVDGGPTLATERESTQPNRDDAIYWASGITWGYVDGALNRLLKPLPQLQVRGGVTGRPAFDQPAPPRPNISAGNSDALGTKAVLDPFEVYRESDTVLRGQLNALDEGQLRNIIREYRISNIEPAQLSVLPRDELIAMIIVAAERRAA